MRNGMKARNKKIWTIPVVAVLTAAVVSGTIYNSNQEVFARASLPGIETIATQSKETPFYVLEVVPDYSYAKLGMLIGEEEPVAEPSNDNVTPDYKSADSIHEIASVDELNDDKRVIKTEAGMSVYKFFNDLKDSAFKYTNITDIDATTAGKSVDITGDFAAVANGFYTSDSEMLSGGIYSIIGETGNADYLKTADEVLNQGSSIFQYKMSFTDIYQEWTSPKKYAFDLEALSGDFISVETPFDVEGLTYPQEVYKYDPADATATYSITGPLKYYNNQIFSRGKAVKYYEDGGNYYFDEDHTQAFDFEPGSLVFVEAVAGDTTKLNYSGYIISDDDGAGNNTDNDDTNNLRLKGSLGNITAKDYLDIIYANNLDFFYVKQDTSGEELYTIDATSIIEDANAGYVMNTYNLDQGVVYNALTQDMDLSASAVQSAVDNGAVFFFIPMRDSEGLTYKADKTGTQDFKSDYLGNVVTTLKYSGGYTNEEWFKTLVLDIDKEDIKNSKVDVITKLASEVTIEDVNTAGLIYLSGTYVDGTYPVRYSSTNDIEGEVGEAIVNKVIEEKKAVVVDRSIIDDSSADTNLNITKTAAALMQPVPVTVAEGGLGGVDHTAIVPNRSDSEDDSYVKWSIFVNDDIATDAAVYSDFTKTYDKAKLDGFKYNNDEFGFKEVKEAIDNELWFFELNGKTADWIAKNFNEKISKATCIRHILSTKELRNVTKESLRVLDIEPYFSPVFDACASNNYTTSWTELGRVYNNNTKDAINLKIDREHSRDIFSIDWFKSNVGASTENIALDGIGIKEFIGRVDDLCSGYDLIYIGLDTAYMNTDTTTDKNVRYKGKNTKFNDTSLNGKVYYHVGDKIKANQPSTNDLLSAANSYTNITDEGIDITPDKLRDLQNYVRAGYAIILSNDFFEKNSDGSFKKTNGKLTINKVKVDEWSYMYDFVYWCINDEGNWINKNVSVAANFDAKVTPNGKDNITNAEEFTKYINVQKLYIDEATYEHPVYYYPEREDMQEYEYIPINDNGVYSLDYKIKLVNDSAVDTSNTTYDCVLYLDIDGDGRYEDNDIERQDGLIITEDGSADVIGQDSSKRYNLVAGKTYRISRTIPEGYVGFLSWKIVFYENKANGEANDVTDTLIRVAKQGYSAVPDYTQQPTIDVLQIVPYYFPYTNGVTLDMSENGQLYDYYKNLKDFKLNVTVVKSNEFISNIWNKAPQNIKINPNYLAEQYYNELCKYDMVAMGFTDVFYWPNGEAGTDSRACEAATMAIRKYVLKGRSMLFTHDLNSSGFTSQYDSWGYLFNMYLRDVQGMDRYGILSKSGYVQNKFNTTYNTFLTDVDDNGNTTKLEYVSMYDIPDCEDPNQTEYPVRKGIAVRPYSTIGYNRWLRLESPFTINLANAFKTVTNGTVQRGNDSDYNGNIGLNAATLLRYSPDNVYGTIALYSSKATGNSDDRYKSTIVRNVNKGQITQYPYHLNDTISVASTHPQYLQLDMETDCTDDNDNDDIVVWYCIGNDKKTSPLSANYNDVRNNYYIYNKGNVTYTGSGHSKLSSSAEDELRLFVNTLVLAYNNGVHPPKVAYKENAWETAATVNSIYLPYDKQFNSDAEDPDDQGGFLAESDGSKIVKINFKTINNNLKGRKVPLYARYYYETVEGAPGAIAIEVENTGTEVGTTKRWFKELPEGAITKMEHITTVDNKSTSEEVADPAGPLTNGYLYSMNVKLNSLGLSDKLTQDNIKFYVRLSNDPNKIQLNDEVLPTSDSMTPLNINFARLYELK